MVLPITWDLMERFANRGEKQDDLQRIENVIHREIDDHLKDISAYIAQKAENRPPFKQLVRQFWDLATRGIEGAKIRQWDRILEEIRSEFQVLVQAWRVLEKKAPASLAKYMAPGEILQQKARDKFGPIAFLEVHGLVKDFASIVGVPL